MVPMVVPSFKSYNLARCYVVKGVLQLECVQEVFQMELGEQELIVLPAAA